MYKVQKKDGSLEDFDRGKLKASVLGAGAMEDEAERVVAQVEGVLAGIAAAGVVKTTDIRAKALEFLKAANPTAATNYENFVKP